METPEIKPETADTKSLQEKLHESAQLLAAFVENSRIKEYVKMQTNPRRFFVMEFLGGISRGLGMALGMSIILAILVVVVTTILKHFITMPIFGQYISQLIDIFNHAVKHGRPPR